jgi:hypothetical protein
MRTSAFVWALLFWIVLPFQEIEGERKSAYAELTGRLETALRTCRKLKLQAERKRIGEIIVRFDADNQLARLGSGYRKSRDGGWLAPREAKKFRNADAPTELKAIRFEVLEAIDSFIGHMEGLVRRPDLTEQELGLLSKDIAIFAPYNRVLQGLLADRGEVYFGDRWILEETMSGIDGRAFLREVCADALAESIYKGETKTVQVMGLNFHSALTKRAQVFVTGDAALAGRIAGLVDATGKVFERIFGQRAILPQRCRFFVMRPGEEKSTFLDNHPDVGAAKKAGFQKLEFSGIVGSSDQAFFIADPAQSADAVVRMCWLCYFQSSYRIGMEKGWVADGLGIYLTEALVRSRLTWFRTPASAGGVQWGDLLEPDSLWMEEAETLFASAEGVEIIPSLNKPLAQLTARDLLIAYGFVGHLVEARRALLNPTLRRIGLGKPPEQAFRQTGKLNLKEHPLRLARWLNERQRMPDVILARHSIEDMSAVLGPLSGRRRGELSSLFAVRFEDLDTGQAQLIRRHRFAPVEGPFPEQLEFYDPEEHAPRQPIPRTRLADDDSRLKMLRDRVRPPGEAAPKVAYDWGRREIRGLSSEGMREDFESTIAPILDGLVPGYEPARAAILRELDGGEKQKEFRAFNHAYTDREGNVYSGVTIFEAWDCGMLMEMPDVDVLGILHDLYGSSIHTTAPIPQQVHDRLYKRIQEIFTELRPYRAVRQALADTLLIGRPLDPAFESYAVAMNSLWIEYDFDPARLREDIPVKNPMELLQRWNELCKKDSDLWLRGRRQGIARKRDVLLLRDILVDALGEIGALEAWAVPAESGD